MARRVNIMMDEESWRVIRRLPRGSRSRAVNAAIREWAGAYPATGRRGPHGCTSGTAAGHGDRPDRPVDPGGPGTSFAVIVTPDASVLLKWVLPGHDEQVTDAALALRDEAVAGTLDLVVPQLWIYEVGNTLARRFPDDAEELACVSGRLRPDRSEAGLKVENPRRVPVGGLRSRVLRCGVPCRGTPPRRCFRHGG